MMHLFEHMYQYENKEFTAEFCHTLSAPIKVMVPEIAELVDSAHGPCHCVAHNIMEMGTCICKFDDSFHKANGFSIF